MRTANVLERVPIHTDVYGVVRVAGTRVTLDSIVAAFQAGSTAEEIAQQYPAVALVDVYSVLTHYLRQTPEVDAYLNAREALADRVREDALRQFPAAGIRERLLSSVFASRASGPVGATMQVVARRKQERGTAFFRTVTGGCSPSSRKTAATRPGRQVQGAGNQAPEPENPSWSGNTARRQRLIVSVMSLSRR